MSRTFLTNIDLRGNRLYNAIVGDFSSSSGLSTTDGSIYFDTTLHKLQVRENGAWVGFYTTTTTLNNITAPTGSLAMNSQKITGLGTPTAVDDAVTKAYVDTIATGINAHDAVSYASTAAITGTYANGTSGVGATLTGTGSIVIDGYTVVTGDAGTNVLGGTGMRLLLKDQTLTDQNGIYAVTACVSGTSWTLTRAYDYDQIGEVAAGDFTYVILGTVNSKFTFVETSKPTAISGVGTGANAITFGVFANGNLSGTVNVNQGGTGATTLTGVVYGNGTSAFTAATAAQIVSAIGSTAVTNATNAANVTGTVLVANGGTGLTSYTAGDLPYYASGTTLSKLGIGTNGYFLTSSGTAPQWQSQSTLGLASSGANTDITTMSGVTSITGGAVSTSIAIIAATRATAGTGYNVTVTGGIVQAGVAGTGGNVIITGGAANNVGSTGGNVTIDAGASTLGGNGSLVIGATNASAIGIGNSTSITTVTGTVKLPTVGTSGFAKLGTGGQLSSGTIAYSDLPTNVGVVARKVTLVGTGSGTTIALTHGLGTNLVTAQVYDTSTSTATLVEVDITVTSTVATATFAATTTLSNYTLVVIG